VKHRIPDLKTSDERKLRPGNVRKIDESLGIFLVKSWGCRNLMVKSRECWNKMQYFGNNGEMLLILTDPSHPLPPPGLKTASSLKSILKNFGCLNKLQ
jgi:hypothetical protein